MYWRRSNREQRGREIRILPTSVGQIRRRHAVPAIHDRPPVVQPKVGLDARHVRNAVAGAAQRGIELVLGAAGAVGEVSLLPGARETGGEVLDRVGGQLELQTLDLGLAGIALVHESGVRRRLLY